MICKQRRVAPDFQNYPELDRIPRNDENFPILFRHLILLSLPGCLLRHATKPYHSNKYIADAGACILNVEGEQVADGKRGS